MGKPFEDRVGFVESKDRKVTAKRCRKQPQINGKGSAKRQAQELQKDPEATTSHHKRHRSRCFSFESKGWENHQFGKKFAKFCPLNGSIALNGDLKTLCAYPDGDTETKYDVINFRKCL